MDKYYIDAVSISFHKLHGPSYLGALVCSNKLIKKIKNNALICGK